MKPCGFNRDVFYPCYGLAESTLLASGGLGVSPLVVQRVLRSGLARHRVVAANGEESSKVRSLVGCGQPLLGQQLVIVDPRTMSQADLGEVGEIWIKGPNVTNGYWNRPTENGRIFRAQRSDSDDGPYLRTGDLGFLRNGNLFVTGRLKEVLIVRGRNLYPQDIELTVQQADPALAEGIGAAFSVRRNREEALVVVFELDRKHRHADLDQVLRNVRRAVIEQHDVALCRAVLIRQASLPRTTSGKPQRGLCREQYLAGELKVIAEWNRDDRTARHPLQKDPVLARMKTFQKPFDHCQIERVSQQIQAWLVQWLVERAGVPKEQIDADKPYAEYGLDSLTAVELSHDIEDSLEVRLSPTVAWNYPTLSTMAAYLARVVGGVRTVEQKHSDASTEDENGNFETLLSEVEDLSDEETEAALARQRNNSL
jgi:acyl carrier protein